MYKRIAAFRRIAFMIIMLALAALACNFQSGEPTIEPTSTATSTLILDDSTDETEDNPQSGPTATLPPPETLPANVPSLEASQTATIEPSSTVVEIPTLAITLTPTGTATRRPSATSAATQPPSGFDEPLAFQYTVSWRLKDASAQKAIATVTFTATGGGGGYRYFRDIDEVESTFEYEWTTCFGNPTTFRVTSANGESVESVVFFHPPCPTVTPFS